MQNSEGVSIAGIAIVTMRNFKMAFSTIARLWGLQYKGTYGFKI